MLGISTQHEIDWGTGWMTFGPECTQTKPSSHLPHKWAEIKMSEGCIPRECSHQCQRALLGSMSVTEQVTRNRSQQHTVYGEHAEIFEAIRSRDENLAVVMMANHLARVKMRMIDDWG